MADVVEPTVLWCPPIGITLNEATLNHGYNTIGPVNNQPGCIVNEVFLAQTAILTSSSMVYRSYRIGKLHRVHRAGEAHLENLPLPAIGVHVAPILD